ncbi:hypothetical protein ACQP2C_11910 [Micromonospora zamorensis]|uniref:hypothetical protein n=1 Tax=Micromonospora zamorensis TaxID=709883 RepID=UPI003D993D73
MLTYIRWYWPDDDLWYYEELDGESWSLRHVELRRPDGTPVAAASLAETLAAREAGGIDAVRQYENRYGVSPEVPFESLETEYNEPEVAPETISANEFEQVWQNARRHLEAQ